MAAEGLLAEKERLRREQEDAARAEEGKRIRKAREEVTKREQNVEKREAAARLKERELQGLEREASWHKKMWEKTWTEEKANCSRREAAVVEQQRLMAEEARCWKEKREQLERALAEAEARAQETRCWRERLDRALAEAEAEARAQEARYWRERLERALAEAEAKAQEARCWKERLDHALAEAEARGQEARCWRERLEHALAEAEARAQEEVRRRAEERERYSRQDYNQANQSSQPETENVPPDPILSRWEYYHLAWKYFLGNETLPNTGRLKHTDVPWPVLPPPNIGALSPDDTMALLSEKAIADFIFAPAILGETAKKKRVQEVILRFHPDKFSRWQHWIAPEYVEVVRGLCNVTTNYLNTLKCAV